MKRFKRRPFIKRFWYPSNRVLQRRIGRYIRRFEKRHKMRSRFRLREMAKEF